MSSGKQNKLRPEQLRQLLVEHFNTEELRTLCFGLEVEYDDLGGEGRTAKARELVAYMQRKGRLPELEQKLAEMGLLKFLAGPVVPPNVVEDKPNKAVVALFAALEKAEARQDWDKVIEPGEEILKLDTRHKLACSKTALAYNQRGNLLYQARNYAKALENFSRAIELEPAFRRAYNNRGNAYRHLRDYDKAISDFDRAIQLNPGYVDAFFNRALAYKLKGDLMAARHDFQKAADLGDIEAVKQLEQL